jgi:hypothetical protein
MPPQTLDNVKKPESASDAFAIAQQLTSQYPESRMKAVVDATKDFDIN